MPLITPFDPWKSPLCHCPPKYSFSPYTGCSHRCAYCYITSYIPNAFDCRPKDNLLKRLGREIRRLDRKIPIAIASSSDPYVPMEITKNLTRDTLRLLTQNGFKVLLVTKSNLVTRDVDVIRRARCSVSMTITTLQTEIANLLEPSAPPPDKRLEAIKTLTQASIPCSIRIDPIIPGINDDLGQLELLIEEASRTGAKHIVASSYKAKADNFKRIVSAFPHLRGLLERTYWAEGEVKGRARYAPHSFRRPLLQELKRIVESYGVTFATCREGFSDLNSGRTCDGTHLIPE